MNNNYLEIETKFPIEDEGEICQCLEAVSARSEKGPIHERNVYLDYPNED